MAWHGMMWYGVCGSPVQDAQTKLKLLEARLAQHRYAPLPRPRPRPLPLPLPLPLALPLGFCPTYSTPFHALTTPLSRPLLPSPQLLSVGG